MVATASHRDTTPVLAVLVCRDGAEWLPDVLDALRQQTVRPRHLLAVDIGSAEGTAELLAQANSADAGADRLLDEIVTVPAEAGFADAISQALEHAARFAEPGQWLWLVHDDSAPQPECLENLLAVAEAEPTAGMLGPIGLDWADPRFVVDAGVSMDASGHRQAGLAPAEPPGSDRPASAEVDPALTGRSGPLPVSEVLAVSSACALVRRDVFERIGDFEPRQPCGDVDLGWRVNADGSPVLSVPSARMRHAVAVRGADRRADAGDRRVRTEQRVHGVRTLLVNTSSWAFVLGVPRVVLLTLFRACGFVLLRRWPETVAEGAVFGRLLSGRMGLRSARATRRRASPARHGVRGLVTSRRTRWRNGLQGAFARLLRERVRRDVHLGRVPTAPTEPLPAHPAVKDAVAESASVERVRPVAGLRRSGPIVIRKPRESAPPARSRPSPVPRTEPAVQEPVQVPVDRNLVLRQLLLSPAVVLTVALVLFSLVAHGLLTDVARFGTGLHGGRLLPLADLEQTWAGYLSAWHPVNGGTGASAPASMLVLALLGTAFALIGGPPTVVALLVLFGVPLAGIAAYHATRALPVPRSWRAGAAAAYALLPAATLSAAEGRLDVVVAHILLPPLLSGIARVIGLARLAPMTIKPVHWLSTACRTSLGLAVLGAFTPLMHVALVVLALLAFVLVPTEARRAPRRVAGMAALVLLPVGCLLPWPLVLIEHPQILVHGLGARITELPADAWLLALSPDHNLGSAMGGVLVLVAVAALIAVPGRTLVPGALVAVVGWVVAVLVDTLAADPVGGGPSTTGWAGAPLLLAGAGLLWMVLAAAPGLSAVRRVPVVHRIPASMRPRLGKSALALSLLVLACGAAFAGRGGPLATTSAPASASTGALLIAEPGAQPARLASERPRFGDDDLVPVASAVEWLHRMDEELLSADSARSRAALAAVAARGVDAVAVPARTAAQLRADAGEMIADGGRLDGPERAVLRLRLPNSPVGLLGPDLARQARIEAAPSGQARPLPVPASLPQVAVRMSDGGTGRALVLAAANEAGWQARVDGVPVPLATAWGHQIAVPLPEDAGEVSVTYTEAPRTTLLVVQGATILFTVLGALPTRRRVGHDGAGRIGPDLRGEV